jgi:hypothetical protein
MATNLTSDLEEKIHALCMNVASVWRNPRLLSSSSATVPKEVVTVAEGGALTLPLTKRPVRGAIGVEVRIREGKLVGPKLAEHWVKNALFDPPEWMSGQNYLEIQGARVPMRTSIADVFSALESMANLPERIFEAFGFKHYEPDQVREYAQQKLDDDGFREVIWRSRLASSIGP